MNCWVEIRTYNLVISIIYNYLTRKYFGEDFQRVWYWSTTPGKRVDSRSPA